jgi:hypothetical protein
VCRCSVKLIYLPPYFPDFNPIEEFFAEVKTFIKRHWRLYEDNLEQGFKVFLEWCVDTVGARKRVQEFISGTLGGQLMRLAKLTSLELHFKTGLDFSSLAFRCTPKAVHGKFYEGKSFIYLTYHGSLIVHRIN